MRDVDDVLYSISRYMSGIGYQGEMLDLSVDYLGPAPQSRSRKRRLALLAAYRVFLLERGGLEVVAMFDR